MLKTIQINYFKPFAYDTTYKHKKAHKGSTMNENRFEMKNG